MSEEIRTVPFFYHEAAVCRQERTIRRLWITTLMLAGALASVSGWAVWVTKKVGN